ncbi:MurT ligase domain-containing protein [Jeotgalibacillus marinus]|uniref:Lipid II isoglutaminyl synthase (glutamine-hydrolyzing) subunit MurT n=1 Tax=Jeotgalibacillus marinus TaxID=86667 RepID=A0ABV3Q4E4_9BACL
MNNQQESTKIRAAESANDQGAIGKFPKTRAVMAILSAKIAKKGSQLLGKGGGNIPGVIARKVDRRILTKLANQVETTIVLTGTNGKTTTSNLLAAILHETGKPVIHNALGNNLLSGVTACYVDSASINGKLNQPYKYAVMEIDESNIPLVLKELTPTYALVTNFSRDQLGRVGEIDLLVEKVKKGIQPTPATLVLNADDPLVMRMESLENPKVHFGIHPNAYDFESFSMAESKFCPDCGNELTYDHLHYGHLGLFHCTCGFKRPTPSYECTHIEEGDLSFRVDEQLYQLSIEGVYNVYNALAAIAVARELGIEEEVIARGIMNYRSSNGRMERFNINGGARLLNLVKNPVGMDTTLSEVIKEKQAKQWVFAFDEKTHDEDISWIWDTDLERIAKTEYTRLICCGNRAQEMALRLKYGGVDESSIVVIEDKKQAMEESFREATPTYYVPTYTALSTVRKYLQKNNEGEKK